MKKITKKYFASLVLLGSVLGTAQAAEYTVDASHSHVGFTVRHIVSKLPGEFKEFEGTFKFDEKNPKASDGKFVVKVASINTNNEKRDAHLKSADFFDAEKFPTITLQNLKLAKSGKMYKVTGDLTMHGVTKSVVFNAEYLGEDKDPWGGTRAGFTATTKLNRTDYGLVWNKVLESGKVMVGEEIELSLQVEAVKKVADKKSAEKSAS